MMKKYIYSSWVATARHLSSSHTISNQPPFTSTIHVLLHYIHVACLWSSSPPLPRRSIFNFVYLAYSPSPPLHVQTIRVLPQCLSKLQDLS